jgi:hypothetical protein
MKAITICQPYAHLIIQGRKTCENRTWPTKHRGPIAIHAGKSRSWLDEENGVDFGSGIQIADMAFGAVVATANLVACIHRESGLLAEWVNKMTREQQGHINGPYCWILADVRPLPRSVPYRGAQGLFDVPSSALGE